VIVTSELLIRETTIDDVPRLALIRYASQPWFVASVANQENWFRIAPPEARSLRICAEIDGQIVGFGQGGFNLSTTEAAAADTAVIVDPQFRKQGIGTAVYTRIEQHLRTIGARRVRAFTEDDPASLQWVANMGYAQGARDRYSKLDTRHLPSMPEMPSGVKLVSLAEAGPEVVYALDEAASIDEPGDMTYDGTPYDLWTARYWHSPDQQLHVGTVAMVDGVAASATFLEANLSTGRGISTGACTLREYRGRGLAKLAKSATLRKAAEAGIHVAITCNDYENAPMIAINDWLGYEVFASEWSCVKEL
jgi:GNAT superfamily N-acetyltransferase